MCCSRCGRVHRTSVSVAAYAAERYGAWWIASRTGVRGGDSANGSVIAGGVPGHRRVDDVFTDCNTVFAGLLC